MPLRTVGVVALALGLAGCRGAYLARLAVEEVRFLRSATPATELLPTAQDPERRRALEALLAVRAFAADQGLDVGGSYREVADTTSAAPFHVVTAARADRLEPTTWWYPVIGAIPYRGYFDRGSAERFAAGLHDEGLDTMIVEASAYSTLGWLDDPLPSNVLDRGENAVVVTVLHELVHQTFFAPGQVAFNETLATAVAWRLAERYFEARGDPESAARMHRSRQAWVRRSDALDVAALALHAFFDDAAARGLSRDRLLAEKFVVYAEVLERVEAADPGFAEDLGDHRFDNASFLAFHRYASGGRAIDAFLERAGDIPAALARLEKAVDQGQDLRGVVTDAFAAGPPAAEAPGAQARPGV